MRKRTENGSVRPEERIRTRVPACSPPHVCLAVSELAAVTSLKRWVNNKVRVIGWLRDFYPLKDVALLESIGEPEGTFRILVNVGAVDHFCVQNNRQVVIFGELSVLNGSPLLTAKIIRECNNLNLQQINCAVEIVRRRFPRILK